MNEKILDLAKKLKALADQGIEGEKENATAMLERFMKKHEITFDMLDVDLCKGHEIYLNPKDKQLFVQVAASVCGKNFAFYKFHKKTSRAKAMEDKLRYEIECTEMHFIEVMAKYEFFQRKCDEDFKLFFDAFLQKNRLFRAESDEEIEERRAKEKPLTREEREYLFRMGLIAEGLARHQYVKQVG